MKKTFLMIALVMTLAAASRAQDTGDKQLTAAVARLDQAKKAADYEKLANEFLQIANIQKTNWLSWYYAAFCNATSGWLRQEDPDNIEPFADKAEQQITKARSFLDTATQKKELSEVFVVLSMLNRARVYMNPATYGREYGPKASQYVKMAEAANGDNPRALYLDGWEKFATPKAWGGDKVRAKEILERAKQKLDSQPSAGTAPHWGKAEIDELLKQLK